MRGNKVWLAIFFVLTTLILGSSPPLALHNMMTPMKVISSMETMNFDEVGTHESRQSLVGDSPISLIETDDLGVMDKLACNTIRASYSEWNCQSHDIPGWDHAYLSFEEYTFDAEVVYSYNIRHHGNVTLDVTTARQGNNPPIIEIEVLNSDDAYEVEVKASVEFTIKRVYKGDSGYENIVQNEFSYSVPFPALVDIDGDGSYKMLGNIKIYTWDNFAELSDLTSSQTNILGSAENLSDEINLVKIDLLALAAKYTSSPVLRAINAFIYVNFDVDLDIEFYLQSAVLPFIGVEGSADLSNLYQNSDLRMSYPCKLALTDSVTRTPTLTNSCTRMLSQDSSGATLQLGLWHEYDSKESYSAHIRVGPQSGAMASIAWNLFTNEDYFQYTLTQGQFLTSERSQDTNLVRSSSIEIGVPNAITVISNQEPVAVLAVTPTTTLEDTLVTATTTSSYDPDSDPYDVQIRWGDGSQTSWTSGGGQATHQYQNSGQYLVSLEVRDDKGKSNTVSKIVKINPKPSTLSSHLSTNESNPLESIPISLLWGSSGGESTANYNLSFGDGTFYNGPSSSSSTAHTYSDPGQYNVQLIVTSGQEVQTKSLTIVVEPDYSSTNVVASNYVITGNQTLVVIDDNDAELYVSLGEVGTSPDSSREALFQALNTVSIVTNTDWDLYLVGNNTGNAYDYNNESGPGLNYLEDYSTVIWTTGNHYYPLTETDFDNLEIYTGAGGTLIMFSQDMLYGDCSYCTEYNSTDQLNSTFSISNATQDIGLGEYLESANGNNVAYTPMAGLDIIMTRNISEDQLVLYSSDYADAVYTFEDNPYALGDINSPMLDSSTGNHAIINLNDGRRIAYFAFDPIQIANSYDLETMMLGLVEWGSDSFEETYKVANSTYLSIGVDGMSTIGPSQTSGTTTRTEQLTHIYDFYVIEGHQYNFSLGDSVYVDFNTGDYEYLYGTCWNGPIADVNIEDALGNTITSLNPSCDWNTGEWSLNWTATYSEKLTARVVSEDLYSNSTWYYWFPISLTELYDSNNYYDDSCESVYLSTTKQDTIYSWDSVNHEDYSNSCFEVNINAGSTYAISIDRGKSSLAEILIDAAYESENDVDYVAEYISPYSNSGEMLFYAYNTTTFKFVVQSFNYSNPLVTEGNYYINIWEVNTSQPVDDYLNATEVSPYNNNIGYIDSYIDDEDWWTIPVSVGESYSVDIDLDSDEYFGVMAYFHSRDDPYNITTQPYINETFYRSINLELEELSFGEIKLVIYASNDGSTITGSRGNYTLSIDKLTRELQMNDIMFSDIGFASTRDSFETYLLEDNSYVIRLNSTPSSMSGTKIGDQLSMNIITPSGQNISATTTSSNINNNTLTFTPSETGLFIVDVYGVNGSYWIWPLIDKGAVFDTYPQRYATAELTFSDQVQGSQLIESESYYYHLTTYQSYVLENGPQGFVLDSVNGNISYSPLRSDVGTHSVSIRIDNTWGESTWQNYSLIVADLPNTAPVISSIQNLTTTVGYQHATYVTASDIDNDILTYSLNSAPLGASINSNTGQISWISTSTGQFEFEVLVIDARGLSTSMNFNISSENSAPIIGTVSNGITNVGSQYNSQMNANDNEGHNMLWGLQSGPSGLTMDINGYITWSAQTFHVGNHTVIVEVTDEYGENSIAYWTIEVPNTSPSVQLNNVPATLYVNEMLSLQSVMQDSDGHQMWLVLVDGPSGMTVNSNGSILWIPRANQIGVYQFEIMVIDSFGESYSVVKEIEVLNRAPDGQFSQIWQDIRTKEVWRILTISDIDGHQVEVMCDSNEIILTTIDNNTILINWIADDFDDSLIILCTFTDEYQSTSQLQTSFMLVPLDISNSFVGDTSRTFGESGNADWTLSLPVESIQLTVISGNGIATSTGDAQDWQLEYIPEQDEGKVIIALYAMTEFGDIYEEVWILEYLEEDNSWSCAISEFEQLNDQWNSQIDCSRNDVSITIVQSLNITIDLENDLILISNVEYGLTTLDFFLEGPDGDAQFITKIIYYAKPISTGSFTEQIIDVSIETDALLSGELIYESNNSEFSYCKALAVEYKSFVTSDCEYVLMFKQSGNYDIEFGLYNESDVQMDSGSISVSVTDPAIHISDDANSQMPVVYASGGMIFSLIIGAILGKLIFQRKEENVFSDENNTVTDNLNSETLVPSFNEMPNDNMMSFGGAVAVSESDANQQKTPDRSTPPTSVDGNGYEWLQIVGNNWFRLKDSNSEWQLFEN